MAGSRRTIGPASPHPDKETSDGYPESYRTNFETLLRAAGDGHLALLECRDAATGAPRYVICAVGYDREEFLMTPFGHLHDGDPLEAYLPPETGSEAGG